MSTSALATTTPATASQASTPASAASATSSSGAASLTKLAGNFNDFLQLLTTQLKNQDPTSPLDTNQFTSQLVQFTSVAEQISTNTTLNQLLTSSLAQQLTEASGLVGHQVRMTGGTLPLQNGTARLDFQAATAGPVQVTVSDAGGNVVQAATVSATTGANTWTWDGTTRGGGTAPDGSYTVAVTSAGAAVPFQAVGTVTGAQQSGGAVRLMFGDAGVGFNDVVSLGN